jgi:hypothetical protein
VVQRTDSSLARRDAALGTACAHERPRKSLKLPNDLAKEAAPATSNGNLKVQSRQIRSRSGGAAHAGFEAERRINAIAERYHVATPRGPRIRGL